jgi:hypothetical protein
VVPPQRLANLVRAAANSCGRRCIFRGRADGFAVSGAGVVRHLAAEALVRLYHALTVPADRTDPAPCVWARIADGPFSLADVVKKAQSHLDRNRDSFWRLILPGPANTELEADKLNRALNVLGAWLGHAMHLLMRDDIDVNAAHNKVKHGLAVRAGIDLATFTPKPLERGAPVPISAVTGPSAVDIFAGPTLDYLARPHKINGRRQGLEITTLNLNPATLLAEGWMIATTFGAMFHIAAARHHSRRTTELATYPRLPLGPTPRELLPDAVVVGLRQPLTTPPDGGALDRTTSIGYQRSYQALYVDLDGGWSGTITDG